MYLHMLVQYLVSIISFAYWYRDCFSITSLRRTLASHRYGQVWTTSVTVMVTSVLMRFIILLMPCGMIYEMMK